MSWRNTVITGVVLGSVLGSGAYVALSRIGAEMLLQSTYEPYTLQSVHGCGLEPESACDSLAQVYYSSLNTPDNTKMQPLDAVEARGWDMQPFGKSYEDELTGQGYVQPVDVSKPQVTPHGQFIQGSR